MNEKRREAILAAYERGGFDFARGIDRPPADITDILCRQAWRQGANAVKAERTAEEKAEA